MKIKETIPAYYASHKTLFISLQMYKNIVYRDSAGSATGIEESIDEEKNIMQGIYDLAGRRIERITKPGIYIIDGRKQLVK